MIFGLVCGDDSLRCLFARSNVSVYIPLVDTKNHSEGPGERHVEAPPRWVFPTLQRLVNSLAECHLGLASLTVGSFSDFYHNFRQAPDQTRNHKPRFHISGKRVNQELEVADASTDCFDSSEDSVCCRKSQQVKSHRGGACLNTNRSRRCTHSHRTKRRLRPPIRRLYLRCLPSRLSEGKETACCRAGCLLNPQCSPISCARRS